MKDMAVALYLRLSREDEKHTKEGMAREESNSIGNQRKLLLSFLEGKGEFAGYQVVQYVDDGYSGVSFQRPGFCQMIREIKNGRIQCVVVKDFSRFGRDYIELGDYLEHIFPFMHVRFISVNDGYDSADYNGKTPDIDVPFRNLAYTLYSQDISEKVKSSLAVRRQRGLYIGSLPPYGYGKGKEGSLVPDQETKDTVVRIYREYLAGAGLSELAGKLNREKVPSPRQHKVDKGLLRERASGIYAWLPTTIQQILCNEIYVDAVIDLETFRKVQEKMGTKNTGEACGFPLKGLVHCGECGRIMVREKKKGGYFRCRYQKFTVHKVIESFPEPELEAVVWEGVKAEWGRLAEKEAILCRGRELAAKADKRAGENIRALRLLMDKKKEGIKGLYCQYRQGELGKGKYLEKKEMEKEAVQRLSEEIKGMEEEREGLEKFSGFLADTIESPSQRHRQALFQCLIEGVYVFAGKRVEIYWKFRQGQGQLFSVR